MAILPVGIGSAEEGGYQIERSLRFNSPDSAYLSRTPASAGNRKTWTWSGWVKRTTLGVQETLFACGTSASDTAFGQLIFGNDNSFRVNAYFTSWLFTTQVFRDTSAWYHFVVAFDTTLATASDRVKLYVNGVRVTAFAISNNPSQNTDYGINQAVQHTIGRQDLGPGGYLSAYQADINFIDGSALDPTSFGEFNETTGVWQPKAYTGSYGTNGFYLDFADNSGTTSTTLGKDSSGNGNNWTPNNFSVTAGAGNDSLVDSPTRYGTDTGVGGEVRGNYCTLNPLALSVTAVTYSEGNLRGTTASGNMQVLCTMPYSGTTYIELTDINGNGSIAFSTDPGVGTTMYFSLTNLGRIHKDGTSSVSGNITFTINSGSLFSWTTNDIIGIAYNVSTANLILTKNGGSTVNITVNGLISGVSPFPMFVNYSSGSATTFLINTGQRPFAYTPPSGFKALCTTNLTEPTIADGSKHFGIIAYSGDNTYSKTISDSSVQFTPDLIWVKKRNNPLSHIINDTVRGIPKSIYSDLTSAEDTTAYLTSTAASGFVTGPSLLTLNASSNTYVAWLWKANGSGVSNTDGTITSTVSVNTTSGFSIATFTAPSSGQFTVGHGLGQTPSFVIVKNRSGTGNWFTYHVSLGANNTDYLVLNTTAAEATYSTMWGASGMTSTTVGLTVAGSTYASADHVLYAFAPVAGYSAFGSYTGNGSTDGPFVYTGFRPRWVMIKGSSFSSNWVLWDTARDTYNMAVNRLIANGANAESSAFGYDIDITANGFKVRNSNADINSNAATFIYAAFAESPFRYSLAR